MDRYSRIVDALTLLARFNVLVFIYPGDDEQHADLYFEALHIAREVGEHDARAEEAGGASKLRIPFSDKDLGEAYKDARSETLAELDLHWRYPPNPAGHTLYCARGCNSVFTTDGYAECAACGATMSPSFEEEFDESLVAAGLLM